LVTCKDFLRELSDFLDENVDPAVRQDLERHITECPNCWVICDTTKKTIEIYRDSQLYELPDDLRDRLRSAIVSKCRAHKKAGPESV
jgi:anti-sigma factor RsiW